MPKKQISDFTTGSITNDSDVFVMDTYDGVTVKIPYSTLRQAIADDIASNNRQTTLLSTDWTGDSAPYMQTVTVSGMTANIVPIIGLVTSTTVATGIEEQKQWSYITKAISGVDSITFYCYETKPTVNLTVNIKVV